MTDSIDIGLPIPTGSPSSLLVDPGKQGKSDSEGSHSRPSRNLPGSIVDRGVLVLGRQWGYSAKGRSPPRHGGNKSNGIDRGNISNYYRRCKLAIGDG